MKITDTELAVMTEQANAIVSAVKEPVGYPGWLSQQHLFSMLAAISAAFKIDAEADALKVVIDAASNIGMAKYRLAFRLLMLINPGQIALFNGVIFSKVSKLRTRALGFAFIELCRAVKLGALSASDMTSDKGLRLLSAEFKRQLRKKELVECKN